MIQDEMNQEESSVKMMENWIGGFYTKKRATN